LSRIFDWVVEVLFLWIAFFVFMSTAGAVLLFFLVPLWDFFVYCEVPSVPSREAIFFVLKNGSNLSTVMTVVVVVMNFLGFFHD